MPELIWDGKYTTDRQLRPLPRTALPFQTVETISHSSISEPYTIIDKHIAWYNRLIWGDKKYVLPSLRPEFAGRIKLIYIDPPFAPTTSFSISSQTQETNEFPLKKPSVIEQKAYYDMYGQDFDLDKYLQWFYETVSLLRDLLATDGSLYVHSDWRVNSYIRFVLDEVFGPDRHGNEIIWHYRSGGRQKNRFSRKHDSLYLYTRSDNWIFNADKVGEVRGRNKRNNMKKEIGEDGRLFYSISSGGKTYRYAEDSHMTPNDVWTDISHIQQKDPQRVGYPTQKPEALLERIIQASSNRGDLVLDCFCGSGTTAVVAEKLGRQWIACDISRFPIHTTRERLLNLGQIQPFVIQNIGNYERQIWQITGNGTESEVQAIEKQDKYRRFMLELYRAQPLNGFVWLHGIRGGRFVHVGSVDAPVSQGAIQAIMDELWTAYGRNTPHRIDILGWDFAFGIDALTHQIERESQTKIRCKRIPREVLERRAKEEVDINFFELAALDVEVQYQGNGCVVVRLTDFILPTELASETLHHTFSEWHHYIDYWAVDWKHKSGVFRNMTQIYRTDKEATIQTSMKYTYECSGTYTIAIKVIDVLGNDTTTLVEIEV